MCCEQVRLFKSQSTETQGPTKAFRFYSFLVSDWSALSENLLWLAENDDPGGPVGHYRVHGWLSPAIGTAAWHTNVDGFKISSPGFHNPQAGTGEFGSSEEGFLVDPITCGETF